MIVANKAKKEIQDFVTDILKADEAFLQFAGNINEFSKAGYKIKSPKDFTAHTEKAVKITNQLNVAEKERISLAKKVESQFAKKQAAGSKLNVVLQKQRFETQQLNKAAKEEAILTSRVSTFYQKQSVVLNRLTRRRQDLILKQNLGISLDKKEVKELKALTRQQTNLDNAIKKTEASNGRHFKMVGKYGNALKGLSSVVGTLVGVYGVFGAIQLGKQLFNEIKEIDGLNKALLQVTETQTAFNEQQRFLVNLADEAGVEINGLQKSYTKFLASAKTTNLTNKETQNIFRQTAKAGAVLGLSTDDLNGSFRALEQILSKGKVQAEEIRGQLGERLPGAFQILAQSMGLTTAQLSKQLELGNVLSEEVLPKFAEELEKVYGLEQVKRVDTLQAAQNRLSNEWNLFIRSVDEGEGVISQAFKTIVVEIAETIKWYRKLNDEFGGTQEGGFKTELEDIAKQAKITGAAEIDLAKNRINTRKETLLFLKNEKEAKEKLIESLKKETNWLERSANVSTDAKAISAQKEQLTIIKQRIALTEGQLQALESLTEEKREANTVDQNSNKIATETATKRAEQISILQKLALAAEDLKPKLGQMFQDGLIDAKQYSDEIDKVNKAIKDLSSLTQSVTDLRSDATITADTSGLIAPQTIINDLKEGLDNLNWDDALSKATDFFTEIGSFASALRDRNIQAIEDEINANDLKYANILNNEQLTQDQRSAIEAEQELKRQELEKKKREEQTKQAKTQKAFSAAQVIANTAVAISKTLAETGVFGIPLTAIVAAQGALQLATVLAQPIPQFKDGLFTDYEGKGVINDQKGRNFRELVLRRGGKAEMFEGRNREIDINKGDRIIPAVQTSQILNNAIAMSAMDQEQKLANHQINIQNKGQDHTSMVKDFEKALRSLPQAKGFDYNKMAKANYYENRAHKA